MDKSTIYFCTHLYILVVAALVAKNPPADAGDARDAISIPESGRSPGEGHGNPLQYSCLKNPMDRGGLQSMGPQSRTLLSD